MLVDGRKVDVDDDDDDDSISDEYCLLSKGHKPKVGVGEKSSKTSKGKLSFEVVVFVVVLLILLDDFEVGNVFRVACFVVVE